MRAIALTPIKQKTPQALQFAGFFCFGGWTGIEPVTRGFSIRSLDMHMLILSIKSMSYAVLNALYPHCPAMALTLC